MAINIYIGKGNLPKDKTLVFDVEAAILAVKVTGSEFQRRVLREVELGTYKDERFFIDRFGGQLYYTEMSTGSKALFELDGLPNNVINGVDFACAAGDCSLCGERYKVLVDSYLLSGYNCIVIFEGMV